MAYGNHNLNFELQCASMRAGFASDFTFQPASALRLKVSAIGTNRGGSM